MLNDSHSRNASAEVSNRVAGAVSLEPGGHSSYPTRPLEILSGEVPERSNGAVSKTVVRFTRTVGSNPTLSANSDCRRQTIDGEP